MTLNPCYVIFWRYSDGSGFGVVRAFEDKSDAQDFLDILTGIESAKQFSLFETYCVPA